MKEKIINCSRCGTNPWKQGCYALWGKSPKPLLHNKDEDKGYICSRCAYKSSGDTRFVDCPIYGIHQGEMKKKLDEKTEKFLKS